MPMTTDDEERLRTYDRILCDVKNQQEEISAKLAVLRGEDKTKTLKFRELMGKKLTNAAVLSIFKAYGLE